MRTRQRLQGLKEWTIENLCKGRSYKAPAPDGNLKGVTYKEPSCFLGWTPAMPNATETFGIDPSNVCPGILIMPAPSKAKHVEEKRFDRYSNVRRPKEFSQTLSVQMLFELYEPGIFLPGWRQDDGKIDRTKIADATEEGLMTLFDWLDDAKEKLLAARSIPGTDLYLDDDSLEYSPYTDQSYIVDKRPMYYGVIFANFLCHASEGTNPGIEDYLK